MLSNTSLKSNPHDNESNVYQDMYTSTNQQDALWYDQMSSCTQDGGMKLQDDQLVNAMHNLDVLDTSPGNYLTLTLTVSRYFDGGRCNGDEIE